MSRHHTPSSESQQNVFSLPGITLGIAVLLLLLAGVVGAICLNQSSNATEIEDAERAAVRMKNLADLQVADTTNLTTYGWNDRIKGIVHIPITKAMELVIPSLNASTVKTPTEQQP